MGFYKNDATAANNTSVNGIAIQGSSSPANIDNALRELAAQGKQFALDIAGATTVGGTADAITITANDSVADAYFDGMIIGFVAGSDNATTSPTANVNAIGAKTIKKALGSDGAELAVAAGDIQSGGLYLLRYRSAWASAAGAFQLIDLQHPAIDNPASNVIINGNFGINQRAVSGTVTLSAGVYGHDRWKAGASGCTYTFATSANVTTITISAGSLVQVIEGLNLQSGTHVLSWTGTVQMKIDGGSAGNSGMTGALTGGTNATVETSGTGTLSLVQLEVGDTATPFKHRSYGQELALCQRYYLRLTGGGGGASVWDENYIGILNALTGTDARGTVPIPTSFRVSPSSSSSNTSILNGTTTIAAGIIVSSISAGNTGINTVKVGVSGASGMTAGATYMISFSSASAGFVAFDAEL